MLYLWLGTHFANADAYFWSAPIKNFWNIALLNIHLGELKKVLRYCKKQLESQRPPHENKTILHFEYWNPVGFRRHFWTRFDDRNVPVWWALHPTSRYDQKFMYFSHKLPELWNADFNGRIRRFDSLDDLNNIIAILALILSLAE